MGHWHPLPVNIAIENQHVFIFGAELSILMGHTQTVTTRGYLGTSFPPFPAVLVSTWPGQGLDAVHRTDHVVIVLEKGAAARESHPPPCWMWIPPGTGSVETSPTGSLSQVAGKNNWNHQPVIHEVQGRNTPLWAVELLWSRLPQCKGFPTQWNMHLNVEIFVERERGVCIYIYMYVCVLHIYVLSIVLWAISTTWDLAQKMLQSTSVLFCTLPQKGK